MPDTDLPDTDPPAPLGTDILGSPLDPLALDVRDNPYARYRALREQAGELVRGTDGVWLASSFDACESLLHHPDFGQLEEGEEQANPIFGRLGDDGDPLRDPDGTPVFSFIVLNPPDHTRIRGLLSQAFTVRTVEGLRDDVTEIAGGLVDQALENGRPNLMETLAYPLPVAVVSRLLGVPDSDFEMFNRWAVDLVRGLDPAMRARPGVIEALGVARREFADYFRALAVDRRRSPGEDLLTAMVAAADGNDRMTDTEVVVTSTLLLVAGYETTANLIGNSVLALLDHPDQMRALRARGEVHTTDVDEFLRYDAPGQIAARVARRDTEIAGVPIPRGDAVVALLGAANRDPAMFEHPDRLDLDRPVNRHLAFGHGIHLCLGRPLARREAQIALDLLLDRTRGIELTATPRWRESVSLRGVERLDVELTS